MMDSKPHKELPVRHLLRPGSGTDGSHPAIFLLHGYGSDEADLFSFASELPGELYVISLRAPYPLQPFGYAWYSIDFNAPQGKWNDTSQAIASRELILETIDLAIEAYSLDAGRISLLGFSQGTILSYALALSYPQRFKSVIALSGYIDPEMLLPDYQKRDLRNLQIYASHGQVDMVIPISWAQQSAGLLKSLKIPHVFEEYPVGHGVSPANLRSFVNWMQGKY